ncbi:MAG: LysM peptidoglycan-binding domain-containing protein [Pseudomonadota bacterium]
MPEMILSAKLKVFKISYFICILLVIGVFDPIGSWGEEEQASMDKTTRFEAGFYYTIQKGDTLWNISRHFYDSPYVWPDLWEKNEYIRNPHWIYPGSRIKLYNKIDISPLPTPVPEMPKKEKPRKVITCDSIDRVGFIRKNGVRGAGEILSSVKHKGLLSIGDTVYIHSYDGAEFKAGDKFTVFRTYKPLKHPLQERVVGVQHLLLGIVVITEVLPDMVTGDIVESYREIHPGDLLMPYEKQSHKIEVVESVSDLEGMIISADEQERESILCEGMAAFIDKGEDDKIKIGQSYDIYVQEKETYYADDAQRHVLPPPVVIGKILVIRTEKNTATALITKSSRDIRIGEKVHAGPSSNRSAVE